MAEVGTQIYHSSVDEDASLNFLHVCVGCCLISVTHVKI